MRGQKGITLVALIITIIVLLILTVVAISSVTNDGVIGKSKTAVNAYQQQSTLENSTLGNYADYLQAQINEIPTANP